MGDDAAIAEAKHEAKAAGAPLQLMTQFLRTVSENRMEDALALAQTILKFEPDNAIILDYQETLAQYINNEREIAAARDEDEEENSTGGSSTDPEDDVASDTSTEGVSGEDEPKRRQDGPMVEESKHDEARGNQEGHRVKDEEELQRLGGMFRDLRERRAAASEESACRWDEDKFAASRSAGMEHVGFSPTRQTSRAPSAKRREVFGESHEGEIEAVLWDYLPDGAKQAAQKRAQDDDALLQADAGK